MPITVTGRMTPEELSKVLGAVVGIPVEVKIGEPPEFIEVVAETDTGSLAPTWVKFYGLCVRVTAESAGAESQPPAADTADAFETGFHVPDVTELPDLEQQAREALLAKPISELSLSVRGQKCMEKLGIQTLGDLTQKSVQELLCMKGFKHSSLTDLINRLDSFGLKLRDD